MSTTLPLPHAYPFVLLDRLLALDRGTAARAERRIAATDPLLDGEGRLPPPLLLEAMAQCAGLAIAAGSATDGGVLVSFDRFRLGRVVQVGDTLEVTARVVRRFGPLVKARGRIRADGRLCAAAEIVLRLST